MVKTEKCALHKLRMDVERSCRDHGIKGSFGLMKLLIIVDFWPVLYYRLWEHCRERPGVLRRLLQLFLLPIKPIVEGASGARIDAASKIGGGLLLHHSSGVVIAPGAVLGENCTLFSGVCIVHKANDQDFGAPQIGTNVRLTVGCKIIGKIRLGDNATVAANAVVTSDVPDQALVAGIPAQVVPAKQATP